MSKVSGKHQVMLPVRVLKGADLEARDEVVIRVVGRGRIEVERTEDVIDRCDKERRHQSTDSWLQPASGSCPPTARSRAEPHIFVPTDRALRLPDALSLAAALVSDAALLTLDKKLKRIAEQVRRVG